MNNSSSIVIAVSGASGSAYVLRLLQVLLRQGLRVDLIVSEAGRQVMRQEIGMAFPPAAASESEWKTLIARGLSEQSAATWGFSAEDPQQLTGTVYSHDLRDFSAGIASGSFRTRGMVICPCSTGTLSAIATGASTNLIHRAADVHLKERRRLILVPRETPLSRITLANMVTVTDAGAVVLPAMPGYYHQPEAIADLVDFVVARICDQLDVPHQLSRRWGETD